MVPVRMLTGLAGPTVLVNPGETFWCDEALALRLIAAGAAERIVDPPDRPEVAQVAPPERAIRKRGRPRKAAP